jgi:peptidoglycan/xylan/chitin deacetylase (PgdA/CDA1 family)
MIVIATFIFVGLVIIASILYLVFFRTRARQSQPNQQTAQVSRPAPADTNQPAEQKPASFVPDYSIPPATHGLAPVIATIPTKQKIVFLGIDDGAFKDQSVVDLMKQNHIKASLFLAQSFIGNNPDFFKQLTALGSVVEDHTLHHATNMTKTESYVQQKSEICGMADYEARIYGRRPTLFRPPGGAYSDTMRKAAYDCGMKAVVTWIAKANGGSMQYQVGKGLRPGDIVLMHFRPEFKSDLKAFVDAEAAAGVHTELLESAPGIM